MRRIIESVLILLLLLSTCFADDNPSLVGYPEGKIMGFMGLDDTTPAPNIQDGKATGLLNVKLSGSFDLRKRYGKSVVNGTLDDYDLASPAISGIFFAEYADSTERLFVFVGNKLKYLNSTTWTTINTAPYSDITAGQNYQWYCFMALDKTICTNNEDEPIKITSTPAKTDLSFTGLTYAVTKAKTGIWYRNYLVLGNTVENSVKRPTRIRWSNVGTIETWTDADYIDIASVSGDEIMSFKELYGDLYIIMKKSIWKASLVGGDDTYTLSKIVDGVGTVSRDSVQVVNFPDNKSGIIFLTEDRRVFLFNGVALSDIGSDIQNTLDGLSESRLQYSVSTFDGTDYYLSVSDGSSTYNDIVLDFQTEIGSWTKHDQIDVNAFARVKNSSVWKTYCGNYSGFVYYMDNPDNNSDVDGFTGIVDSVGYVNTSTSTGSEIIMDSALPTGLWTGCIVKITSGTAQGEERIVLTATSTGIVVTTPFTATPDTTSIYSMGGIDAYYTTKWYDFADAPRIKSFKGMYFWAAEDSNNQVTVSYSEDFGSVLGSETKSLSPAATSLWDSGLWDEATWGSTGDKFYNVKLKGRGRNIQIKFSDSTVDKTFHLYGFHLLADKLDVE